MKNRIGSAFAGVVFVALLMLAGCASSGLSAKDKAVYDAIGKKIYEDMVAEAKNPKPKKPEWEKNFSPMPHDKTVRWQIMAPPLTPFDIAGSRLLSRDRLFLTFESQRPRLINTNDGSTLWELKLSSADEKEEKELARQWKNPFYACIMAHKDMVLIRSDSDAGTKLFAVDTATGNMRWTADWKKSGGLLFIPLTEAAVIVVIQQEKKRATLTALTLTTGAAAWKNEFQYGSGTADPPVPSSDGSTLWTYYDGVARLAAASGKTEWHRQDILAGRQNSPMQLEKGRLHILDGKNRLHILDARTGKTLASEQQRDAAVYTNIFPIGDRVYLRGLEKEKSGEPRFFVAAVRSADAKELWTDIDKDPSVSNLIDENRTLYFSTPFTVIALDRETGTRRFAVRASDIGKTFPVQIRKYGDKIVYIGELVIAAFDTKTGAKVYRHGFDPMNQTAHMDALNEVIERKQQWLSWFTGPWSDWDLKGLGMSEFFLQQATYSQNQSNYAWQQAAKFGRSYEITGDSLDASRSAIKANESMIDSSFARAQFSMGMAFMTAENVQRGVAEATAADRKVLQESLRIRKFLYAAYVLTQQGDYVYRPIREEEKDGAVYGISIIHLPSGREITTKLDGCYNENVYCLVDFDHGIAYYTGFTMAPKWYNYYVARPVAVPK